MRATLRVLACAAVVAAPRGAAAQLCHVMPPLEPHAAPAAAAEDGHAHDDHAHPHEHGRAHHVMASVTLVAAAIDEGGYQGAIAVTRRA